MSKRVLIGIGTFIVAVIIVILLFINSNSIYFDRPKDLSNKTEKIEVGYVNWACDCADFYELKLYNENSDYELSANDCIFIEPKDKNLKIPEQYFDSIYKNKNLRLKGQFFLDEGISKSYEMKTSEKPKYSRVFQYESFEIIDLVEN